MAAWLIQLLLPKALDYIESYLQNQAVNAAEYQVYLNFKALMQQQGLISRDLADAFDNEKPPVPPTKVP